MIAGALVWAARSRLYLVFYDAAGLYEQSYRDWMWGIERTTDVMKGLRRSQGQAKILMVINLRRVVSYRVTSALESCQFLMETLVYVMQILDHERILVLLDNAWLHHTS